MPEVVSRKCPNCAGVLPPLGSSDQVTCEYCGYSFDVKRTVQQPAAPAPRPIPPAPIGKPFRPAPMPVAPRASRGVGCIVALGPILALVGIGASFFLTRTGGGDIFSSITQPSYSFHETVGLFQVNADGIEDVAMFVRTVTSGDELHLAMFDGATGNELWKVSELGSYTQGYEFSHAAVASGRVLLTDFRGQARILDLATGMQVGVVALPDRAKEMCAGATPNEVRLVLQNGNPHVVDITTGAGGPPQVVNLGEGDACARPADLTIPQGELKGVTIPGVENAVMLTQGDLRVAVGRRASGVRVPMAAGIGPDGLTPTWTVLVPTVPETEVAETGSDTMRFGVGGGRLYVAYSLTTRAAAHVTAFDARTGARLWDTEYGGWASSVDVDAIFVGPTRLVLEQFGEAEIFDANTGALLRRVAPR